MKTVMILCFTAAILGNATAYGSEEELLSWTSAAIQCGRTPEAGAISCEIKTGENGWERFVIQAFDKTHPLDAADLKKLDGFPLESLRTSHEAGYEQLGGYTVHFRFDRTFYSQEKKLVTEIIYVSVNKNGMSISDKSTKER